MFPCLRPFFVVLNMALNCYQNPAMITFLMWVNMSVKIHWHRPSHRITVQCHYVILTTGAIIRHLLISQLIETHFAKRTSIPIHRNTEQRIFRIFCYAESGGRQCHLLQMIIFPLYRSFPLNLPNFSRLR